MRADIVHFIAPCPCGAEADWTAHRPVYDSQAEYRGEAYGPEYEIQHDGPCSGRKTR